MTVVRFAPSPTGYLHVGNIRVALINWLVARANQGTFVLRLDDTDPERSKQEYAEQILEDLAWLGLDIDQTEKQSARFDRYDAVADDLRERGLLYACHETPEELDRKRARRRTRGLPPIYDRSALDLTAEDRDKLEAEGRTPHWRFLLPNHDGDPKTTRRTEVTFEDLVRGTQTIDLASVSDPVLVRADGTYLYTLPSVIDDIDFGVTHVIRGEDHVTNTGVQVALFKALGGLVPRFAHHNLLTLPGGEDLSKRTGSLSVMSLREEGLEANAVAAIATLIGTSQPVRPIRHVSELVDTFDLSTISRSAATFDPAELANLNARIVHQLGFADVADRLTELGIGGGEAFWLAVRGNLAKVSEAAAWWRIVSSDEGWTMADMSDEDRAFVRDAGIELPSVPWSVDTWGAWTTALEGQTGRKGKALFMPLRLALTGQTKGPDLALLLPHIGPERTRARLAGSWSESG